jgi:hypothetical protein
MSVRQNCPLAPWGQGNSISTGQEKNILLSAPAGLCLVEREVGQAYTQVRVDKGCDSAEVAQKQYPREKRGFVKAVL